MKDISKADMDIYERYLKGEKVDDLAFEFDRSNNAIYKTINRVKAALARPTMSELQKYKYVYIGEGPDTRVPAVFGVYRAIETAFLHEQGVTRESETQIEIQIDLTNWDANNIIKNRRDEFLDELKRLTFSFVFISLDSLLWGFQINEKYKAFDDVAMKKRILRVVLAPDCLRLLERMKMCIEMDERLEEIKRTGPGLRVKKISSEEADRIFNSTTI